MTEEEQERFEDYLELEQYIEQLRLQQSARPPAHLTPQQMRIYSMAMLFHTASPRVADPDPKFSEHLRQRLLKQIQDDDARQGTAEDVDDGFSPTIPLKSPNAITGLPAHHPRTYSVDVDQAEHSTKVENREDPQTPTQGKTQLRNIYQNNRVPQPDPVSSPKPENTQVKKRKRGLVSRRTIFTGGAIAASLLAGVGIETAIEHASEPQSNLSSQITGNNWLQVTSVGQLGTDPVFFNTNTITGYVIRPTGDTSDKSIIAFSAACTHLGCIVQWNASNRQFPCPCHSRTFDTTGNPVYQNDQPHYLSLPRLETKIEDGYIYVNVPT